MYGILNVFFCERRVVEFEKNFIYREAVIAAALRVIDIVNKSREILRITISVLNVCFTICNFVAYIPKFAGHKTFGKMFKRWPAPDCLSARLLLVFHGICILL